MELGVDNTKLGSSLDIKGWKEIDVILNDRTLFSLATNQNNIFLIGGRVSKMGETLPTTDVMRITVTSGNEIKEVVETDTPLPVPLFYTDTLVTEKYVYVIGGCSGDDSVSTIYRSTKKVNGDLDTWEYVGDLPYPVSDHKVIRIGNSGYVIGGFDGSNSLDSVIKFSIDEDEDDELIDFTVYNKLPYKVSDPRVVVLKDKVYIIGGYDGINYAALDSVYCADISDVGNIGEWKECKSLPFGLFGSQLISYSNRVFLLGGNNGTKGIKESLAANVDQNGVIDEFKPTTDILDNMFGGACIVTNVFVYLIGNDKVYRAPFDGFDILNKK